MRIGLADLSTISRRVLWAALAVAILPIVQLSRLEADTQLRNTLRIEDVQYTPAPEALPLVSLGYRQALADLLWVSALVYFGEQVALRAPMRYLDARAESIIALDPRFRAVYRWMGVVSVYNTGMITKSDIETSSRYLERAIKHFPRDGELYYLLAFNYAIELTPYAQDEVEKNRLRRRAAELFAKAAVLPGSRPDAALMAAEMSQRGNDRSVAIAHLRSLLTTASDDRIRDQLVRRLAALTSEEEAERADADRRQFVEAWLRDFPYLDPGMFGLVGERSSLDDADLVPDGDGEAPIGETD